MSTINKKSYKQTLQGAADTVGDLIEKIQRLSSSSDSDPELILRLNLELWEPIVLIDRTSKKELDSELKVINTIKEKKVKKKNIKEKLQIGQLF